MVLWVVLLLAAAPLVSPSLTPPALAFGMGMRSMPLDMAHRSQASVGPCMASRPLLGGCSLFGRRQPSSMTGRPIRPALRQPHASSGWTCLYGSFDDMHMDDDDSWELTDDEDNEEDDRMVVLRDTVGHPLATPPHTRDADRPLHPFGCRYLLPHIEKSNQLFLTPALLFLTCRSWTVSSSAT